MRPICLQLLTNNCVNFSIILFSNNKDSCLSTYNNFSNFGGSQQFVHLKPNIILTDCKGLSSVINRLSSFNGKYYKAVIEYD